MIEKYEYIIEKYTDEYHTLFQAIKIDNKLDKTSNGLHSKNLRATINPNLHLYSREYIKDNGEYAHCDFFDKWEE